MKRMLGVTMAVTLVALLAGAALAHGPGMTGRGWMGGGMGPGMMGPGAMGAGPGGCPGWSQGAAGAPAEQITEDKARELATAYADKYFKGYTVERVLPFAGRFHTMYQVELKGPKGEIRSLHVTPWGGVRPFGPLAAAE